MEDDSIISPILEATASNFEEDKNEVVRFTEDEIIELITRYDNSTIDQLLPRRVTAYSTSDGHKIPVEAYYWSIAHGKEPESVGYQFIRQGKHDTSFFDQPTLIRFTHTPLNQAETEFYYDFLRGKTDQLPESRGLIAGPDTPDQSDRIRPLKDDEIIDPETKSRAKVEIVARYLGGKWQVSEEEIRHQEVLAVQEEVSRLLAATKLTPPSPH